MNLTTEIFNIYQDLYNESTDEFWEIHSERLGYSVEILREIFGPKEGEYDTLVEFVNEYLQEKVVLRDILNTYEERDIDIIDINSVRNAFIEIISNIVAEDIQEILDDEDAWGFSIGLCEAILIVLEENLLELFQEGY